MGMDSCVFLPELQRFCWQKSWHLGKALDAVKARKTTSCPKPALFQPQVYELHMNTVSSMEELGMQSMGKVNQSGEKQSLR